MKLAALIADTFREIYAKKMLIAFMVIQAVTLIITGFILFSDGMQRMYKEAAHGVGHPDSLAVAPEDTGPMPGATDTALLGGDAPLPMDSAAQHDADAGRNGASGGSRTFVPKGTSEVDERAGLVEMVKGQMGSYATVIALATLFLGIFVTAGIVPSMMEKGTIDLLLSKPLPRVTILFGRALGGLIAIAGNLAIFLLALWALYGLAASVWYFPFVIWTFVITSFTLFVLLGGVILLNVVTESWVLPMILGYLHLMILAPFLYGREQMLYSFISSTALRGVIEGLYYMLPQTSNLINSVSEAIYTGGVDHALPFVQGLAFVLVTLSWAAWRFQRKDF